MKDIALYVKLIVSFLGMSYPILFQVITKLDDKYESEKIVTYFDSEKIKIVFVRLLQISLVLVLIETLNFQPFDWFAQLGNWTFYTAKILVVCSSIGLVIYFFLLVDKILIYYTPAKFIRYLIKKHDKATEEQALELFETLSDVFMHYIKKENRTYQKTALNFYYSAFKYYRVKAQKEGKEVVYPDQYYALVYDIIEELCLTDNKRFSAITHRTISGVWFLGELKEAKISKQTYTWLWRNILLAIKNDKDDMVMSFWENAHQYITYNLKPIYKEYAISITNEDKVKERVKEREKFLEFQYAMCALMLYREKHDTLRRFLLYTTSQPAIHELLPKSMNDVFKWFFYFDDPYDTTFPFISSTYYFPKIEGVFGDGQIKECITDFIALLFIRQYFIVPYLIIDKPLDLPQIPNNQSELKLWIDTYPKFEEKLQKIISNETLLKAIHYDKISEEHNKILIETFFNKLKEKSEEQYTNQAENLPLDSDKINLFFKSSQEILESKVNELKRFFRNDIEEGNTQYVSGQFMLQKRDAFSEKPEVHYMDYETSLANQIKSTFDSGILSTLNSQRKITYVLKPEQFLEGLKKLNIPKSYVFIIAGLNFDNIKNLNQDDKFYQNIEFIDLGFSSYRVIPPSLFILPKSDLPNIGLKDISQDLDKALEPIKISENEYIWGVVYSLNTVSEEIKEKYLSRNSVNNIKTSVLLGLLLSLEIHWKSNPNIIQFIEYSQFRNNGIPNEIDDLIPIMKSVRATETKKSNWIIKFKKFREIFSKKRKNS